MKYYTLLLFVILTTVTCKTFRNSVESYDDLDHLHNAEYGLYVPDDTGKEFPHFSDKMLTYMLSEQAAVSAKNIKRISVKQESGRKVLRIDFDKEGARLLEEITAKYINEKIAIVADGRVISAPVVMHTVKGGSVSVTGLTDEEIKELTKKLVPKS